MRECLEELKPSELKPGKLYLHRDILCGEKHQDVDCPCRPVLIAADDVRSGVDLAYEVNQLDG